jgi:GMP synthase-like glutamine amidotransferase
MRGVAIIENSPAASSYFSRLLSEAGIEHFKVRAWLAATMPRQFDACIITGGLSNITDGLAERHRRELDMLDRLEGRKLFASCFGHQLVAHWRGGTVARRGERLLRWERVTLASGHPATAQIPGFDAVCMNIDEVVGLPDGATRLGWSASCENQVLSYGDSVLTCQAHPEMSMRRGYRQVRMMALAASRGRGLKTLRQSAPSPLPSGSPFMSAVIEWLVS